MILQLGRSCGVSLQLMLEWGCVVRETYNYENRMEEIKVATDSGSIVSFLLTKVSDLEATNKVLVENGKVLNSVIMAQDTKIDMILDYIQDRHSPSKASKRARTDVSPEKTSQITKEINETAASEMLSSSSMSTVTESLCQASASVLALYVMRKGHKAQELFYDWYVFL